MRKPVFGTELRGFQTDPTQIRLCSHRRWFGSSNLDYDGRGTILSSENKEADQLHSYCAADLRLCFRVWKKWFSYDMAHLIIVERTMIRISMLHFMLQKFVNDEVMKSKNCMM